MRSDFKNHIKKENFFSKGEKVILAISGGVDSVVLLHLLQDIDVKITCAHVNYNLRGSESDKDELFVKSLCKKLAIPLEILSVDTKSIAKKKRKGTQEVAREIRYEWFDKLRSKLNGSKIITAHHKDDSVETFFINLIRGTGTKGLTGIHKNRNDICRPLLFTSKLKIRNFAQEEGIEFRQDLSNFEDKYLRNNLRNRILPLFEEVQPSFFNSMEKNMNRIRHAQDALNYSHSIILEKYVEEKETEIRISKDLFSIEGSAYFLHEILSSFGFTESQVEDILGQPAVGKSFVTDLATLYIERDSVLVNLEKRNEFKKVSYSIGPDMATKNLPIRLIFSEGLISDLELNSDSKYAFIDKEKLKFPLTLRLWEDGDKFQPLGMHGKKLISDFLTQIKVETSQKRNQWILLSGCKIVWVVGHRLGHEYRITDKTKTFVKIWCDGE